MRLAPMPASRSTSCASLTIILLVLVFANAQATRSDECPGGCIIASVVYPVRRCECVVPQCEQQAQQLKQQLQTAAVQKQRGSRIARQAWEPPRMSGVDCQFCERDAFTYSSFKACYAADKDFKPVGPSISTRDYPSLAEAASSSVASAAVVGIAQACPPPQAAGCQDLSGFTSWQSLFSSSGSADDVSIPSGTTVVLHGCAQPGSTVTVKSINVPQGAKLIIGDSPLQLRLQRLTVSGTFQMGTAACPITSQITVTVPGGNEANGVDVSPGATYDVHGKTEGLMWTRVAATVPEKSKTLSLREAVQWKPGQQILLTTTTWKDEVTNQNEVLTVASVSADGLKITTQQPVMFQHYGGEYQAEVALLTRSILFTSDDKSTATKTGPHTTMQSADCRISGAAFERWGAVNSPGRYPIHFHLVGDAPDAFVKNNAVYNSNWRCVTLHGTNDVYVYGNVGFDVNGHCYYLEDGVEERNVLERNLAAYVHPIQTAGSEGGQQGTDRWQGDGLFDPSDSGAAGFYSLNAHNTWLNNAASGGFAGYTFPHAPRAIKEHKNVKKSNGFPFDPSQRPFIKFQGNTAHSTGYFWEHSGCFYFGGMLFYKKDPSDNQVKLFYNNGRGSVEADPLCPDPDWPADDGGNWNDCWVGSSRNTRTADDTQEGFLLVDDSAAALCNVGIMSWGERIEVKRFQGFDVTRGSEFLGQSWMTDSLFRINTDNTLQGFTGWPHSGEAWWEGWPVKGFEWYDTTTSSLLSNITFENYKYVEYTDDVDNWWHYQGPCAFRMLSHSDQYKPDKTMMVTKEITCNNCDLGTCKGGVCSGNAFFRLDKTYRGSSWMFNWLDQDGTIIRKVAPSKPPGAYLIGSYPDWWKLEPTSYTEQRFSNAWITPMPANEMVARIDLRIGSEGNYFTYAAFDGTSPEGQNPTRIGFVSQFGDVSRQMPVTKTEGTTGMTGKYGWYTVFNVTEGGYHAPKRLELIMFNVPRNKAILWASCWPPGTTITIEKRFDETDCLTTSPLPRASSRDAVIAGGGENYFIDGNNCVHMKLTDPGQTWQYEKSFQRDGMYIEELVRWYNLRYIITTDMSCADPHFCQLPGNPATRVPAAVVAMPSCNDLQPTGNNCGTLKCGWMENYSGGCSNNQAKAQGLCKAICGTCPLPTAAKTLQVFASMSRAVANNRVTCTVAVEVKDAFTGSYLPAGIRVVGQWSKTPDRSLTDGWPFTAQGTAAADSTGKVWATIRANKDLPAAAGNSCIFTVTRVTGTGAAGYKSDWNGSTKRAVAKW